MSVRLATSADTTALVRVINRAYVVEAHIFEGDRTDEAEILERLGRPNACFLVIDDTEPASERGALAGAVYVETREDRGYFGMLSVDPDRQGRGLGRALIAAAEAWCSAAACAHMDIDVVDQRLELPGFYSALGYSTRGVTPFPNPRCKLPVKMIHMAKALP
jgi:GNAT superfamily N-acetyltransferase